jgi:transposase
VGVLAEIGDLSRFQNPRELMGYLGLVPSESSTGDKVKRGGITKAGNGRDAFLWRRRGAIDIRRA